MSDQELFKALKTEVLQNYQRHFPFYKGDWKNFSSQDIRQLIQLIEDGTKQKISEKWIYTHLKKDHSNKLPRKDMMDILAQFCGFSGWDEFRLKKQEQPITASLSGLKLVKIAVPVLAVAVILIVVAILFLKNDNTAQKPTKTPKTNVSVLIEKDSAQPEVEKGQKSMTAEKTTAFKPKVKNGSNQSILENNQKNTELESTKAERKTTQKNTTQNEKSQLTETDYKLILKGFIKSDIKDWQTRKRQLSKILSENLEAVILLKKGLGAEYLNKNEFSRRLIIPTKNIRSWKITKLKTNEQNKIRFIRIAQ
jgi:predicted DNA-binding transcriptional regulator AlpA